MRLFSNVQINFYFYLQRFFFRRDGKIKQLLEKSKHTNCFQ